MSPSLESTYPLGHKEAVQRGAKALSPATRSWVALLTLS